MLICDTFVYSYMYTCSIIPPNNCIKNVDLYTKKISNPHQHTDVKMIHNCQKNHICGLNDKHMIMITLHYHNHVLIIQTTYINFLQHFIYNCIVLWWNMCIYLKLYMCYKSTLWLYYAMMKHVHIQYEIINVIFYIHHFTILQLHVSIKVSTPFFFYPSCHLVVFGKVLHITSLDQSQIKN